MSEKFVSAHPRLTPLSPLVGHYSLMIFGGGEGEIFFSGKGQLPPGPAVAVSISLVYG